MPEEEPVEEPVLDPPSVTEVLRQLDLHVRIVRFPEILRGINKPRVGAGADGHCGGLDEGTGGILQVNVE